MKTTLVWMTAALPIIAIVAYCFLFPQTKENKPSRSHPIVAPPDDAAKPQRSVQSNRPINGREALEEATRRADESAIKMANVMTPELRRQVINHSIKTKRAKYRPLFESWNLGADVEEKVMEVIRKRDTALDEALHRRVLKEISGNEYLESRDVETSLADIELGYILGANRFKEFSRLEYGMEKSTQVEARKILNRMSDE